MKKIGIFVLLLTILMGSTSCHNHVSSDGTVTESESNSLAVTEPVTESVAPEPDLTNAIHMFKDPSFKMGMYHTGIKNSLTAGRFDHALTVPQWLYTQEGSKHNLAEEGVYSNPAEGVHVYEDTSKLLYLDTNTGMFRLDFRASREYTAPKISAGSLVTPTMIRDIYVTEMEHLYVTLDFTLNEVTNYMSDEDFDVHQHTIQWDFYMFFQDSKSHQWFYLGLPLYDIRGTGKTTYIAGDAGTGGTMVYIPSYKKAYGEGVKVDMDVHVAKENAFLPRFGVKFKMPADCEELAYFGRGPVESYIDKKHASRVGCYKTTVTEHFEHYVRPQENMAHIQTRWMQVSTAAGQGLLATNTNETKDFSFNCSHFTARQLTATAHDYELKPLDETVVHIDYRHSGIGSNSCGPELDKKWRLDDREFRFSFRLLPVLTNNECPFEKISK